MEKHLENNLKQLITPENLKKIGVEPIFILNKKIKNEYNEIDILMDLISFNFKELKFIFWTSNDGFGINILKDSSIIQDLEKLKQFLNNFSIYSKDVEQTEDENDYFIEDTREYENEELEVFCFWGDIRNQKKFIKQLKNEIKKIEFSTVKNKKSLNI